MREQLFTLEITETEIQAYAAISGDNNPIHVDKAAALAAGFSTPCAHGMLVTGKLMALLHDKNILSTAPKRTDFSYLSPIQANEQLKIEVSPAGSYSKVNISNKAGLAIKGTIEF